MRSLGPLIVAAVVAVACGSAGSPQPAVVLAAPSATAAPTVVPSPTASPGAPPPVSAGPVPQAGIVYVWGPDDGIYRYDGTTGALTRVWGAASLQRESAYGPYVLGRHGGTTLLKWDGTTQQVCGGGNWSVVSTRGQCAWTGVATDGAVYTDSPEGGQGAPLPRMLLPADWGAGAFAWDWSGLELAIVRNDPRPEPVRQHQTLWVMDLRHGSLRKVFDPPSETSFIFGVKWSDRRVSFWESATTSASFGADGVLTSLHVVDVDTAAATDLGVTLQDRAWAQWSADGRLAFVRGGGRETWFAKQVVVLEGDGRQRVVAGDLTVHPTATSRTALAPAWQPAYRQPQLAWIESPAVTDASPAYFHGIGPAAERVAITEGGARIECPAVGNAALKLVAEGIRLSADATSALLLCRIPGVDRNALQLWYAPMGRAPRLLVSGLGDLGFGFYGLQPSLLDMTAWSLADR